MDSEEFFKAGIVFLIVSRKPEEALEALAEHYRVGAPRLKVGIPKGHVKSIGCYVSSKKTIFVSDQGNLYNPYVILHEFYHHLRMHDGKHKGTEKYADKFAEEYVEEYRAFHVS